MEGFFYRCCTVHPAAELKDFIYRTYQGAARDIFALPWREGVEIVSAGREKAQRHDFWLMYCNMYPRMTEETFIGFDEWYNSLKVNTITSQKTSEDIIADVNNIINMTIGGDDGIAI